MVLPLEKQLRNLNCNNMLSISVPLVERYKILIIQTDVKRVACGIWKCKACKITFAGGAFEFSTSVATTAKVTMNRLKKLKEDLNQDQTTDNNKDKKEKKDKKKAKQ